MPMQLRGFFIWGFLMIFVGQLLYAPFALGSSHIIQKHQQLKEREQHLVAELIQLELALDKANRDYQKVQSQLGQIQSKVTVEEGKLAKSRQQLALCRKKLGQWVRHYYMEGQTQYLWILLGATDLRDFVNRLALVAMVISQSVGDINKTFSAQLAVQERANALEKLQNQLVDQRQRLEQTLQTTKQLQANRQQFLAAVRQELGASQGEVLRVVEDLHNSLKPLENVLARFQDAPWDRYRPDHLQWLGTKVEAQYSQQTLSKLLFGGAALGYPVQVKLANEQLTFQGTNQDHTPFSIAGQLSVSGGNVCYKPMSIEIGGDSLSPELVQLVAGKEGLTYPVGILMGWQLHNIQIKDGVAIFELVHT